MFFDALGRLALGQIQQTYTAATTNVGGVSGAGVAGVIRGSVGATGIVGVAGQGVAGIIRGSVAVLVIGAAGVGVAGQIRGADAKTFAGVSGQGIAGNLAGGISISVVVPGVAGVGRAGSILSSTATGTIQGVAGQGVAGQIFGNVGGVLVGVSGQGIAGIITVTISGGGGNGPASTGDADRPRRRHKNERVGLERVKKMPPASRRHDDYPEIKLPPRRPPVLVDRPLPPELVDPLFEYPTGLPDLQQVKLAEFTDQQEAEELLDLLAFLDTIDN